jgi:hypothetical protein
MFGSVSSGRQTVQLRHRLPDGSEHVDWMIAQDPRGEAPLLTFRLPGRVDELAAGDTMAAERIADHRPAYLTFEGALGADRGTVTRLARGTIVSLARAGEAWRLGISWEGSGHQRLRLRETGSGLWEVSCGGSEEGGWCECPA